MLASRFLNRGHAGAVGTAPPAGAQHSQRLAPARPKVVRQFQPDDTKTPVPATSTSYPKPYKILSLDGGGSWALIQAKVLKDLGYETGHQVLNDFDLVAANSGGSLVLGGLVVDMPLEKIEDMFCKEEIRRQMFHDRSWLAPMNKVNRALSLPRYSTQDKLDAIRRIYDDAAEQTGVALKCESKFSDEYIQDVKEHLGFKADLLIAAFDYDRHRCKLFRSNPRSAANVGGDPTEHCRLVEAMNASTNAPVKFFDKPASVTIGYEDHPGEVDRFWDGAVAGCNNPVLRAVTEALANGVKPADIIALSIGTGTARLPLASDFENKPSRGLVTGEDEPSFFSDIKKMASTILDDPPDSASFIAHVVLTNGDTTRQPLVRMNPFIRPLLGKDGTLRVPKGLVDGNLFRDLCTLDMDAVKQDDVEKIERVTQNWMDNKKCDHCPDAGVVNQPIQSGGHDFEKCVIGHPTYAEAKKHWKEISQVAVGKV